MSNGQYHHSIVVQSGLLFVVCLVFLYMGMALWALSLLSFCLCVCVCAYVRARMFMLVLAPFQTKSIFVGAHAHNIQCTALPTCIGVTWMDHDKTSVARICTILSVRLKRRLHYYTTIYLLRIILILLFFIYFLFMVNCWCGRVFFGFAVNLIRPFLLNTSK